MKERDDRLALDAAALAGEILLESGAEIFRVEDTIYRIAAAYGVEEAEAFVLSSGIFLTSEGEGRKTFARVKHIPLVGARLDRVSAVNQLSREIEQGFHTPEEAMERLEAIRAMPRLPAWLQVLASGVGSGCFCVLFGGDWADALAAAAAGLVLYLYLLFVVKGRLSKIASNITGGALVTLVAVLLHGAGLGLHLDAGQAKGVHGVQKRLLVVQELIQGGHQHIPGSAHIALDVKCFHLTLSVLPSG